MKPPASPRRRRSRGTSPTCRDASAAHRRRRDPPGDIWHAGRARDTSALEPRGEALRQRKAQVGAARAITLVETRALHRGRKPAAHGFDFGEFGHGLMPARRSAATPIASPCLPRYGPAHETMRPADTDFGYRRVPLDEKQGLVDDVFHSVARRYDLMNDLMSGGLHRPGRTRWSTAVNPPRTRSVRAARRRRRHRRRRLPHRRRRRAHDARTPSARHQCRACSRSAARAPRARTVRRRLSSRPTPRRCRFPTALRRLHDRVRHPQRAAHRRRACARRIAC